MEYATPMLRVLCWSPVAAHALELPVRLLVERGLRLTIQRLPVGRR
jgi:hypothetical protein